MSTVHRFICFLWLGLLAPLSPVEASLDRSFGANGSMALPGLVTSTVQVGVVHAPNGATYVLRSENGSLQLTRLRADGSLDVPFGSGGSVTLDLGGTLFGGGTALGPVGSGLAQADGSLVLPASSVLRINAAGQLDRAFGQDGKLSMPRPPGCAHINPQAIVPGADGELLVYGKAWDSLGGVRIGCSLVWRLRADMTVDTSFGGTGFYATGALVEDIRVVDGGGIELIATAARDALAVWRLTRAGAPDPAFGRNGVMALGDLTIGAAKFLAEGSKLVVRAGFGTGSASVYVHRFRPDNAVDETFGNAGVAVVSLPAGSLLDGPVLALPDGGYVVEYRLNSRLHFFKLDALGRLDAKFGSGGHFMYYDGSHEYDELVGWTLQPDGYLVFVVRTESDFAIGGPYYHAAARLQLVSNLVEFHNTTLDHYFLTYDGAEARGIDNGAAGPGWSRTQQSFRPGGTRAVCRFYGTPGVGPNSHFFTVEPGECEEVKRDRGWTYEGLGFYATPSQNGTCAAPLIRVHRLYNNRWMHNDSNHRYTVSPEVVTQMQARGWTHEGVVFCAKP